MKWLHFILSHSIFISICAAALCLQTYWLLHIEPNKFFVGFIFFSTVCSYNFYWLISKYSFSSKNQFRLFIYKNQSYLILFFLAGIGMAGCVLYLQNYLLYILIAILLTLLYSLPLWPFGFVKFAKKAGFLKTILLAATWAYVTVLLPALPVFEIDSMPVWALFSARFCFMLLLCILFDMRDMQMDKMRALHSLATDVSKKQLAVILYAAFGLYIIAGIFVRNYFSDTNQQIAFVLTGVLVWVVYQLSLQKPRGYYFYYFLVDGLMLISPIATYIAAI